MLWVATAHDDNDMPSMRRTSTDDQVPHFESKGIKTIANSVELPERALLVSFHVPITTNKALS